MLISLYPRSRNGTGDRPAKDFLARRTRPKADIVNDELRLLVRRIFGISYLRDASLRRGLGDISGAADIPGMSDILP